MLHFLWGNEETLTQMNDIINADTRLILGSILFLHFLSHKPTPNSRNCADETNDARCARHPQALQPGLRAATRCRILDGALSLSAAQPLSASGVNGGFTVAPHRYWVEEE